MTFAREKRILLGWLAALAPVPLPFNEILTWPYLLAYEGVVAAFLWRASRDPGGWLPAWAMNVLAVAYLPYFVLDLRVLSQGRLVAAVTHLLLFTVLVKLFALRRERDKWQTAMAVFFLFLTSMATSVHPSVALYLVAFTVLGLLLFTRFAQLHLIAGFTGGEADREALVSVPLGRFLAAATLATLVLSVPLFAFMPRVKNPLVTGRGQGLGNLGAVSGFTDEVTLDSIGTIRTSQEVAMRLRYDGPPPAGHEMRYKGGVFDHFRDGSWRPGVPSDRRWSPDGFGRRLDLAPAEPALWVEVFLRPVTGRAVPVPVDALVVEGEETGATFLFRDPNGVVWRAGSAAGPLDYRVGLAGASPAPVRLLDEPGPATLDTAGVTPRVAELAARAAGEGAPLERARRLEEHLTTGYAYSLDFVGRRRGGDPIETFLFDWREGHCEYFASSMVLMLRSLGIPARLATGFLGAEYHPLEGYWVVRQSNAHAWVEAYLPELGWTTFDPTPSAGRPAVEASGLRNVLVQAWDYVLFRWDRYVLTYGFNDQMEFLGAAHGLWRSFLALLPWSDEDEGAPGGGEGESWTEGLEEAPAPAPAARRLPWPVLGLALVLVLAGALVALRRARRPLTGADAYRRLRTSARQAGLPVREADPPLGFRRD
ncbi:MAG TPA: DUF3488 and transglutaminase-like domain-containing protein, partial [Thermoanaerobaculia bacterium]